MAAILKMALPVAAFPVTAIPMSGGAALPTDDNCYDLAYVGKIGRDHWMGCEGTLIADIAMLRSAGARCGDGSFTLFGLPTPECGADVCTYADSICNVFTGQMRQMTDLFRDACPSSRISETGTSRA